MGRAGRVGRMMLTDREKHSALRAEALKGESTLCVGNAGLMVHVIAVGLANGFAGVAGGLAGSITTT